MEKELSPITISGIEYESTPIKRNEEEDIVVDEFLIAKDQDTTISINDNELEERNEVHIDSLPVSKSATALLDPVNMSDSKLSTIRNRKSSADECLENINEVRDDNKPLNVLLNPRTPYTVGLYFQLLVNIILWSFIIYFICVSINTIQSDINLKVDEFTIKVLDEIAKCSKEFARNKCHLPDRPSIMDEECDQLERCQNQDPTRIAKLKVTIELIAEIINTFVNRLSYKSLLIMLSALIIFIIHTTLTFEKFSQLK